MALTSSPIPSLHNGVSQQSPMVRSPDQCEDIQNGWLSLAEGTGKRAPTETVARLMYVPPAKALIHQINRDVAERYNVIIADGTIRIFGMDGEEVPVTAPGGWGYIASATNPAEDLSLATVADYTFVVNRKIVTEMQGDGAAPAPGYAIWANRSYGQDGQELNFGPGMAYQYPPNPVLPALSGTLQSFAKLPETATAGQVFRISGTDESSFRTYYVRRNGGVWDECFKPGMTNGLNMATMPHALVRQSDGSFVFAPFSWAPRRVGDEDTNPNPTFIGRPIQKVFIYQNRLALITGENVVFSVAGDLGNFWRMTVLDYLDSDVISLAATSTQVSLLIDAVPFNDGILLTSDQTQFSLSNGEDGVSATNIAIRPVTSYEVNPRAGMVAMGSEVYFATERSGFSAIREYSRIDGDDAVSAADITAHVPHYIPAGVHKLIPLVDLSALLTLTDGDPSAAYVYQFYWASGTEKLQSAFHRWDFGTNARVLSGAYMSGQLYLLIARPDGLFLERMNLQAGITAPGLPGQCYLDRRTLLRGVAAGGLQGTILEIPYTPVRDTFRIVRTSAHGAPLSVVDPATYKWLDQHSVQVPEDLTAGPVLVGENYTFRYRFSPLYLRRQDGSAITNGRTQVRTFTISYRNTGFFKTLVAPYGVDPRAEEVLPGKLAQFTGKVLGSADLIVNSPAFHTGDYSFSVLGEGHVAWIELVNDTHVASTFIGAEWEAFYWSRARG